MKNISIEKVSGLLRTKRGGYLYHRESRELEFKEQFNFAGLPDYLRDFAAFGNCSGGYLVFGVTDSPRKLIGLNKSSIKQFRDIDPGRISGFLSETFDPEIIWEQGMVEIKNKKFGVFYIHQSKYKPIIAKKNEGREQTIKNGDIYYRYGGRTQKIKFSELHSIIHSRLDTQNKSWADLISKIARAGPENAAVLDLERGVVEKRDDQVLVLDKKVLDKIQFIREGNFSEKEGSEALKLVGDVHPINSVEVVKIKKERLTDLYPYSALELASKVKGKLPSVSRNKVWEVIRENEIKTKPDYSAFNFRNKKQEEEYEKTNDVPAGIPSLYNQKAVDFITETIRNEKN